MELIGEYVQASRNLSGELTVTFAINDDIKAVEKLEGLKGQELAIDVDKYRNKRSLNANKYFWKLCDMIARALGSDKDTVYILQLKKYGVWTDIDIVRDAIPMLISKTSFRYVEELEDGYEPEDMATVRCYWGSSHYDTAEMSHLINGTVQDAHELGISTLSDEEVKRLIQEWRF